MARQRDITAKSPAGGVSLAAPLVQRKCSCGSPTSALTEECDECKRKKRLQAKLTIGASNDPLEQEADRVANEVLAGPARSAAHISPLRAQRSMAGGAERSVTAPASVDRALAGPGKPLDAALQADMGKRFGHDFSRVRVHCGAAPEESAREIGASAYTVGGDVVFGAGQFAPTSHKGRRLIAHELTHVVQQSAAAPGLAVQRKGVTFGGFMANLFQSWDYSQETLTAYLKVLDDTKDIEDDDDSDDKARQVVRDWKSGAGKFNLTWLRKALLIREMLSGSVLGSDQEGILILLESTSSSAELSYLFGPGGVRHQKLLAEFGKHKKELLDFYRRRFDVADEKEIAKGPEPLQQQKEAPKGGVPTFQEALVEGAEVLHKAGFGKVCGTGVGPDEGDGYDARDWKEIGREKLVATVEPWLAFQRFLKNLGKDVPSSTGGKTKWSFDCYGFAIANRVYAEWRMLTREEFNKKNTPLELGMDSRVNKRWKNIGIMTTKPGERPFTYEEGHTEQGVTEAGPKRTFAKPMKKLLDEAPIGSKVVWTNLEALKRCQDSNWTLGFCAYANENTIKVGPDKYSAHPFGVVSESYIKEQMAAGVFPDGSVPKGYIEKNIFVSVILHPNEDKPETV